MKISKLTKILPIALALSLSIGSVNAAIDGTDETGNDKAQINYSLTLNDYIKITQTGGVTTADGSYGTDYATLDLTTALSANFKVISNAKQRSLWLSSPTAASGAPCGIYGYNPTTNDFYLVFVHSTANVQESSVTGITGKAAGSANKEDSPNAFAFKVNAAVSHTYSDGGTGGSITGVMEGDHIKFTMDNGIATLGYTLEKQAMTDTFNTRDTSGTYTATLLLTDKGAI